MLPSLAVHLVVWVPAADVHLVPPGLVHTGLEVRDSNYCRVESRMAAILSLN